MQPSCPPAAHAAEPEEEVEESKGGEGTGQPGAKGLEGASQAKPQEARRPVPSHLAEAYSSEHAPAARLPALPFCLPACPPASQPVGPASPQTLLLPLECCCTACSPRIRAPEISLACSQGWTRPTSCNVELAPVNYFSKHRAQWLCPCPAAAHLLARFLLKAVALVWTGVMLQTTTLPRLPQLVLEGGGVGAMQPPDRRRPAARGLPRARSAAIC